MYELIYHGLPVTSVTIRGDGVSDLPRPVGCMEPTFQIKTGKGRHMRFDCIEQCYAFISFLSLCGYEALYFEVRYVEV